MRGTVRKRTTPTGEVRFDVYFRAGGRGAKTIWKTFTTKGAADDYLATQTSDIGAGVYRRIQPDFMAKVFEKWMDSLQSGATLGQVRRSTMRSYVSVTKHHLIPAFGRFRSDQLQKEHISAWKSACAETIAKGEMAVKSYNNLVGALSVALAWAREIGYLAHNPLPRKLRARPAARTRPIIQGAEIDRLWRAAPGQDRLVIALALFGGCRRGEIFGLDWKQVHWPVGRRGATLEITQAFVQRQMVEPKTAAGRRHVSLPGRLVELLREHHEQHPPIALPDGSAFVIRQADGQAVDPDGWTTKVFPALRQAAKLPETITLHCLRHSFGSLLLADGAPIRHVSEAMGHANVSITLNVYAHTLRATSSEATRALDKYIPTEKAEKGKKPALRLVKSGAA